MSLGLARVTYIGGYLLPGSADILSATRVPNDLEHAAIEQVAYWFQNKDHLKTYWPTGQNPNNIRVVNAWV